MSIFEAEDVSAATVLEGSKKMTQIRLDYNIFANPDLPVIYIHHVPSKNVLELQIGCRGEKKADTSESGSQQAARFEANMGPNKLCIEPCKDEIVITHCAEFEVTACTEPPESVVEADGKQLAILPDHYLSQDFLTPENVEVIFQECEDDASLVIDKSLAGLVNATSSVVSKKCVVQSMLVFASLLAIIIQDNDEPALKEVGITTRTGRVCSNALNTILNHAEPDSDYYYPAISELCDIIFICINHIGYRCSKILIENGLLSALLKVSSLENPEDPDLQKSLLSATSILNLFTQHLAFGSVLAKCSQELRKIDDLVYGKLLSQSSATFKQSWSAFETVLLEQLLLSRMFKGHLIEYGACALNSCGLMAIRKRFQKCAGCSITLYCSNECQKADWQAHRCLCEKTDEKSLRLINKKIARFPRQVAAVQIERHWKHLEAVARRKGIARKDMAFRVLFDRFPFQIEVLDVRQFLNKNQFPHALVAGEFRRADFKNFAMVIVRCNGGLEVPYLAWIGSLGVKKPTKELNDDVGKRKFENNFVDEDERPLFIFDVDHDPVIASVHLAKRLAAKNRISIWDEGILDEAVDTTNINVTDPVSFKERLNA